MVLIQFKRKGRSQSMQSCSEWSPLCWDETFLSWRQWSVSFTGREGLPMMKIKSRMAFDTLTRVPETGTTNAKAGSTWWPSALHFFFILCPATSPPTSSPAPSLQFYLPSPLFPSLRPFLCPTLFLPLLPPYRTLFISSHIPSLHPSNCL